MYGECFTVANTKKLDFLATKGFSEDSWIRRYMLDTGKE